MAFSINELGITSTITLIICAVILVISLICINFRRRARNRAQLSRPLEIANQRILITIKDKNKMARVRKKKFTGMLQIVLEW